MIREQRINRRAALSLIGSAPLTAIAGGQTAQGVQAVPDQPVELKPSGADIGSLIADIERLAAGNRHPLSFLEPRFGDLEEWKRVARQAVLEAFSHRPEPVDPRPEVLDRQDLGGFIREKVVFSTTAAFRVPAYVHVPKNLNGRGPAIVDLHSHGGVYLFGKEKVIDFGRNHPLMDDYHARNYGGRPTSTALVRRGYVVITTDAFMFGERRLVMDDDLKYGWDRSRYSVEDARRLNSRCGSKEDTLVKSLTYAGVTWPGIVTWDDLRTVDYLISRPEVDPGRIGCVGVSFGGWRALFLAALDQRIAAACVAGFMSTVKPMIRAHMDTHSFVHFVPSLHRSLDLPDVASLMAPKPLMVLQCRQDSLFPMAGMQDAVSKIAASYRKAGAGERFTGLFYDGPHRFDVPMQEDAFAWFDRHLKG